jgi:hypothetical protein
LFAGADSTTFSISDTALLKLMASILKYARQCEGKNEARRERGLPGIVAFDETVQLGSIELGSSGGKRSQQK